MTKAFLAGAIVFGTGVFFGAVISGASAKK